MRFLFTKNFDIEISKTLLILQISLNNSSIFITRKLTTKFIYETKIRNVVFCLTVKFDQDLNNSKKINIFKDTRLEFIKKTKKATFFVNVKVKIYYDVRHKSLLLKFEDETYIRLHHDYKLFNQINKKLKNQRCESFKIIKRVKRLAYELQLSLR